jgi:RNA polymerase sigma-70 factor (ECF subfamily)
MDADAMYRQYAGIVLRRARQILGDEHEARDALHDIFLDLLKRPSQFRGDSAPTTWLYVVTTHHCLNRIRRRKNRMRILDAVGASTTHVPGRVSPEARLDVATLLQRLPPKVVEAAIYYHLDGLTHEEIAVIMRCSRRNVGKLLDRLSSLVDVKGVLRRASA